MPDSLEAAGARKAALEARLPCPVCLGVQMEKVHLDSGARRLTLDHCTRCGGVWFEKGETQHLATYAPSDLWRIIPPRQTVPLPLCHGCHAPVSRDAERCLACGTTTELRCPMCQATMERRHHGTLTLDICARDRGVWFDHAELRSIWTLSATALGGARPAKGQQALAVGGDVLLESLFWAPHLTLHAGASVADGIGSAAGAIGGASLEGAASVAMGAADAVGGAAQGVFEFVLDMIGSLFD